MSFIDTRGVRHTTAAHACTVLEAAALGLRQIQETAMVGDDGVLELTVDVIRATSHRVPLSKLKAWLGVVAVIQERRR